MKLYISGDMEGVAGVCAWQQVDARTPHPEYSTFRRYYTQEIRAAIDGAREGGATDVLVNDAHGPMYNLLLDELAPDIRVIFGNRKPYSMVQDARGFNGAFFIGYHGGAGEAAAVLSHTYTPSVIYRVLVNGVECSEATLNAGLLGAEGIPLLLITGDRTTVEGAQARMPWVRGVIVKESIGYFAADSISPTAAQRLIQSAAAEAIRHAGDAKPYTFEPPITLDVQLCSAAQADLVATIPGFERRGGRSVRFVHDDYHVTFKAFIAIFRMGALTL